MMRDTLLSINIPVHNYDCHALVTALHSQLTDSGEDFEIIVAEDGSTDNATLQSNSRLSTLSHCRYISRKENVGRARICNLMIRESKGMWILIMDADAVVPDAGFIKKYLRAFSDENVSVVHGGLYHSEQYFTPGTELRWTYERAADRHRSAAERNKNPFRNFSTFNVAIRRDLLATVGFDEDCKEYGYEDTLLGLTLRDRGATILHIDNPLIHAGLDSNESYLCKVETSLRTLKGLGEKMRGKTTLLQAYERIQCYHLLGVARVAFPLLRPLMRRNLLGRKPNLKILSLYKLGYYISLG